jgi:hypothetical protein
MKWLNKKINEKIAETPKELQIKCSNPIRDYCHLLSNRLVHLLIDLAEEVKHAEAYYSKK